MRVCQFRHFRKKLKFYIKSQKTKSKMAAPHGFEP